MTNKIKDNREALKISQAELAKACGFRTASRIGNYETGIRTPCIEDARKIVETLNKLGAKCTFDDVFPPKKKKAA